MRAGSGLTAVGLALSVAACATPYGEDALFGGGVSAKRIDETHATIRSAGNSSTSTERAEGYAMRKAADFTLAAGYDHFRLIGARDRSQTSSYTGPGTAYPTASAQAVGQSIYGQAHTTYTPGMTLSATAPVILLTIEMVRGELPGAFDATSVIRYATEKPAPP